MPLKWAILILLPILIQFNAGCLFIGNNNLPGSAALNGTTQATPAETSGPAVHRIITIPQDSPQADYVIMDRDIYQVGDTIRFYLMNEGGSVLECANFYPDLYVRKLLDNGTYQDIIRPTGPVMPMIGQLPPGAKSKQYTVDTSTFEPGYYQIAFDCGNVSRNFEIRDRY